MLFVKHCRLIELHSDSAGVQDSEWHADNAGVQASGADISSDSDDADVLDDPEKNLATLMRRDKSADVWQCTVCTYSSKRKYRVTEHVKSKHIRHQGYNCDLCDKTCSTPSALRMHKNRKHRE